MNLRWIAAAAVALALAGCTLLRMGESQATLTRLLERQTQCDADAKKTTLDLRKATECSEVADGLVKLAGELADEARKVGTSAANAVFFYRRAATAAWRSEQPKAMQDAVTYARAGLQRCPSEGQASEIPPGDCALLHVMPALITHDEGVLAFRSLTAGRKLADTTERRKLLFGEDHGKRQEAGPTPAGAASEKTYAGWVALRHAMKHACGAGVDESVRAYVRTVHADMVTNLQRIHEQVFLAADRVYADTDYAGVCEGRTGEDGHATVLFRSQPTDILRERANGEAWCRWQFAKQNPPTCLAATSPG